MRSLQKLAKMSIDNITNAGKDPHVNTSDEYLIEFEMQTSVN